MKVLRGGRASQFSILNMKQMLAYFIKIFPTEDVMILNIFTVMVRNVFYVKHLESLLVDGEDGHRCCTFCWSPACHTVWQTEPHSISSASFSKGQGAVENDTSIFYMRDYFDGLTRHKHFRITAKVCLCGKTRKQSWLHWETCHLGISFHTHVIVVLSLEAAGCSVFSWT